MAKESRIVVWVALDWVVWSRDSADLNGLQHVGGGDVGHGHDEVALLHHASRFQERECPPQVALHVAGEVEAERD